MVRIGEVDAEVHVSGKDRGGSEPAAAATRKEELRDVVRQLIREELRRYLRTEARR